jgi:hypothetical protein
MKRNVSVVCVYSAPDCCNTVISGKIIKDMPGSVASGTDCTTLSLIMLTNRFVQDNNPFYFLKEKYS